MYATYKVITSTLLIIIQLITRVYKQEHTIAYKFFKKLSSF